MLSEAVLQPPLTQKIHSVERGSLQDLHYSMPRVDRNVILLNHDVKFRIIGSASGYSAGKNLNK